MASAASPAKHSRHAAALNCHMVAGERAGDEAARFGLLDDQGVKRHRGQAAPHERLAQAAIRRDE